MATRKPWAIEPRVALSRIYYHLCMCIGNLFGIRGGTALVVVHDVVRYSYCCHHSVRNMVTDKEKEREKERDREKERRIIIRLLLNISLM